MHSTKTAINALPQFWTSLTILVVQISKCYLVKHLSSTLLWNTGLFKYQYRGIKLLSTNQWRRGGYVELVHINTRQADKTCMLRCKDIKFILLSWKLQKVFAKKKEGGYFSEPQKFEKTCLYAAVVGFFKRRFPQQFEWILRVRLTGGWSMQQMFLQHHVGSARYRFAALRL